MAFLLLYDEIYFGNDQLLVWPCDDPGGNRIGAGCDVYGHPGRPALWQQTYFFCCIAAGLRCILGVPFIPG